MSIWKYDLDICETRVFVCEIVLRGDTSVGPHRILVPRSLAELFSDWHGIDVICANACQCTANLWQCIFNDWRCPYSTCSIEWVGLQTLICSGLTLDWHWIDQVCLAVKWREGQLCCWSVDMLSSSVRLGDTSVRSHIALVPLSIWGMKHGLTLDWQWNGWGLTLDWQCVLVSFCEIVLRWGLSV